MRTMEEKREGPISKYVSAWWQDVLTVTGWALTAFVAVTYLIQLLNDR